ncbi:hypothetical protein, partial [Arthrobacter sp. H5]|uniref:hypothetical protein n=1 Tax=Arthrobacter sp. H5 TaxID=1267973 RepID=UPI00047FDD1C
MSSPTAELTTASGPHLVTADHATSYRTVVRSGLGLAPADAASPVYPFVLSTDVFDGLVERLGEGENTVVHLSQELMIHRLVAANESVTARAIVCAARRETRGLRL